MNRLYPAGEDNSNVFHYKFFFRLTNIQALLGEDESSSATELAARADLLVAATAKSSTSINSVEEAPIAAVGPTPNSNKGGQKRKR